MIDASEQMELESLDLKGPRGGEFLELTKPRLNSLVLMTTFVGFYLASSSPFDLALLFHTLAGTFMVAGAASAFNQVWERENDARMNRTRRRPLPSGRVEPWEALVFGSLLGLAGTLYLAFAVNVITSMFGLLSFAVYVFAYTPLKSRSAWNTVVGAVSGALPPVMGWTAVRGHAGIEAWVLFGILFLWQHPHFFALSWRYREDYARGGFKMLSAHDADGSITGVVMTLFSLALLPVSVALTLTGVTGPFYLAGAVLLGIAYLAYSIGFARLKSDQAAKKVFLASLLYLPVLLALMMADKIV